MNKAETAKIISTIQEVYPSFMTGRTAEKTVAIWQMVFDIEPYSVVSAALVAFMSSDNKGFPPVPGQIKEKIAQMNDTEPDERQAWNMILRSFREVDKPNHTAKEEYSKLHPLVRECVGSFDDYRMMGQEDEDTLSITTANAFMRTYRARAQKQREYGKLPEFAKSAYPALAEQEPYRLPLAREVPEPVDDRVGPPDSVMQMVAGLRKSIPEPQETLQEKEARLMKELKQIGGEI
jgi:hypothetical protein